MTQPTIILGFDGSDNSKSAAKFAIDMAKKYGAGIKVIHAIDWSPYEFHTIEENENQHRTRKETIEADRRELFPPLEQEIASHGLDVESQTEYGHPATVLAEKAEEADAVAIVVGRRGMSVFKRALFGSIASTLVHETTRPVMIVP